MKRSRFAFPAVIGIMTLMVACSDDRTTTSAPRIAPATARADAMFTGTEYDVTTAGATATVNGARITQMDLANATGSGQFDPFLRVQASPTEQGYNTSYRPVQFNEDNSPYTTDLRLDNVPILMIGGTAYREFYLDVNQSKSESLISLEQLKVFVGGSGGIHGVDPASANFGIGATPVYDLNGSGPALVKLDYNAQSQGSGSSDIQVLIPNSAFGTAGQTCQYDHGTGGADCGYYVYLYSKFGPTYPTNSGFEEWAVRIAPYVTVATSATPSFTRTWQWSLAKAANPATINMFNGDQGQTQYTVTATKGSYVDGSWAIAGNVVITNPSSQAPVVSAVSVQISGLASATTPTCPALPYTLAGGASMTCTYSSPVPDGTTRTVTASVTLQELAGYTGSTSAVFGSPTTEVNGSIHVTDTNSQGWNFSATGSQQYTKTFACGADQGAHDNTASIDGTSISASATVTVNCYALGVVNHVNSSLTRTWAWSIDKDRNTSLESTGSLTLQTTEPYVFNYAVSVNTTGFVDSNWGMTGSMVISNPAPIAASVPSASVTLSGVTAPAVSCPATSIAAGGSMTCTYSASLPDATSRTSTATAVLQNHSYPYTGSPSNTGTTSFSSAPVTLTFTGATITKVDDCVAVTDSRLGSLGTACVTETLPKRFTYTYQIGPYASCGSYTVPNTATFTTDDQHLTGSDTYTVNVSVPCNECTLTQGYWKTHNDSFKGGAPTDEGWGLLAGTKEATAFFISGANWFDVFWTAPKGNQYYNLAHQYMAAKLNVLNGSSPTSIAATMTSAEAFFAAYMPGAWPNAMKAQVTSWASALDAYNNANHCSEDRTSSTSP